MLAGERSHMLAERRAHGCAHRWAYWGTHLTAGRSDRSAGRRAHMPAADGLAARRTHRPVRRLADRPARGRALRLADVCALRRSRECGLDRTGDSQRGRRRHDHRRGQRHHNFRRSTPHCNGPPSTSVGCGSDHSRVRQQVRRKDLRLLSPSRRSLGVGRWRCASSAGSAATSFSRPATRLDSTTTSSAATGTSMFAVNGDREGPEAWPDTFRRCGAPPHPKRRSPLARRAAWRRCGGSSAITSTLPASPAPLNC